MLAEPFPAANTFLPYVQYWDCLLQPPRRDPTLGCGPPNADAPPLLTGGRPRLQRLGVYVRFRASMMKAKGCKGKATPKVTGIIRMSSPHPAARCGSAHRFILKACANANKKQHNRRHLNQPEEARVDQDRNLAGCHQGMGPPGQQDEGEKTQKSVNPQT